MASEDPVVVSISSQQGLHPEEIARRTFPPARKGVDAEAVRRYLESIADDVRQLLDREQALRRRLAEAERRAADPDLDEQTLLRLVGQETARILQTAHDAAADVVAKAEARAGEILEAASTVLDDRRAEAEAEATRLLTAAEEEAAALAAASAAEAESLRAGAREESEALSEAARAEAVALLDATRAECRRIVSEARELRASVLGDLADRRRSLRVQLEQLRTGRDSLLDVVDTVADTVDQLRDRLANAEHEARLAAAEAGERVAADSSDDEEELDEVELAVDLSEPEPETEGADLAAAAPEPGPAGPVVEVAAEDETTPAAASEAAGEPPAAEEPAPEAAPAEPAPESPGEGLLEESPGEDEVLELLVDEGLAGELSPKGRLYDEEAESDGAGPEPAHRSVDELFAKIRASRVADRGEPEGGTEAAADAADERGEEEPPKVISAQTAGEPPAEAGEEASAPPVPEPEAETEQEEAEVAGTAAEEVAEVADPSAAELARRSEVLDPIVTKLARTLKRVLQDDQNLLLDALRHRSGAPDLDLLAPEPEQRKRFEEATALLLAQAFTVGHSFLGGPTPSVDDAAGAGVTLAGELSAEVTRLLRHRLGEALAPMGEGDEGATDAASAAYREWRGGRIEGIAADFATRSFALGAVTGSAGTPVVWVVDDDGQPCPDCDDNALAGEVPAGEEFPTGQTHPPVHPGCRCLLVLAAP